MNSRPPIRGRGCAPNFLMHRNPFLGDWKKKLLFNFPIYLLETFFTFQKMHHFLRGKGIIQYDFWMARSAVIINRIFFNFQDSNPALRLKDEVIAATLLSASGSGPSAAAANNEDLVLTSMGSSEAEIDWQYFDEHTYIEAKAVKEGEDAYARNKFNQLASDGIASNRHIPDTRSGQCKARHWKSKELPPTSVIITFHNEARSTLLRTIVR